MGSRKRAMENLKNAKRALAEVIEQDKKAGRDYETDNRVVADHAVRIAEKQAREAGVPAWRR
ncbi:hypothetical protein [Marinactinospora rubrisoli]|uniref:Antitoxin n=1 Tax=Marinactinospora rubrisoli TaxID=2715399 RepID=A0ABW2KQZ6_9ACTN